MRIGADAHPMQAGDYVCFPAGQKAGHCLVNESAAPCRYVIVGERNPNEVVVYTDSNKVLVRALGRRAIYDLAARRGYWDGEDTGAPARGKPAARGRGRGARGPGHAEAADLLAWTCDGREGPGVGTRFGGRCEASHLRGRRTGIIMSAC